MKKYILKSLFVSVLCMLAASCQDTEFAETLDSSKAQVMFSIAMDSPSARSRATWGDEYTPSDLGDEYDNRIDLDQFIVKIEAGGNTYNVTDIIKWKDGETNEHKFVGIVKTQNGENVGNLELQSAKITVYANMGSDENANFATMTFNQDAENIPMWGVLTVNNLKFAPGKREDVTEEIYLLRAMAKFQVSLGDAAIEKGYTLAKASLNKFNQTGNCMPTGYGDATHTKSLELEGVLNENTSSPAGETVLTEKTENGNGYVIYLPEISNTTDSELKMLLTFSKEGQADITSEVSVKDYSTANSGLLDIVRNHWYKYVIEDIVNAKPVVKYEAVEWCEVNIAVGGEGFLGLSTDLVEVFSANTGTLKFSSSSPIVSVKLKDIYKHEKNGTFTEGTEDGVKAYYITKYGQKIQLGENPGFDIVDQETALAKEAEILSYIDNESSWDADVNEGTITINSPYINHETYGDSHNDTPRYLEFEVTNKQGLTATFRMMQYPPVVITNVEGYFSYREDFRLQSIDDYQFDINQFRSPYITEKPGLNSEPTHYKNPEAPFFFLACFFPYHEHEWDPETKRVVHNNGGGCGVYNENGVKTGSYLGYEETIGGSYERDHLRVDSYKGSPVTGTFHRTHYNWTNGSAFLGSDYNNTSTYYQSVGIPYAREVEVKRVDEATGEVKMEKVLKYFVRHYTGNSFNFFWAKYVETVYADGKAMLSCADSNESYNNWIKWYTYYQTANHRMYHIKSTKSTLSSDYTLGWPEMQDVNGRKFTAEGEVNSRKVSPSFMVASHLGATDVPKDRDHYTVPLATGMYTFAQRQCEQYVEAIYEDTGNDGEYTPNEDPITHYSDWRLPTKAELEIINQYQDSSRAMDQVLNKESYFCASQIPGEYNNSTILFNRSTKHPEQITDYHIRCVRDVKPGEKLYTRIYPI